jgi:HD-GYP domain-containing protein (c-di-GMP phosphodiesterase class II)
MADHARNVRRYSVMLARELGLSERMTKRIEIAATLHDVGLLALPDSVLLSKHNLSKQEKHLLRQHPLISVRVMEGMEFLEQEIPAVRYHHEWFDGSGYPEGLSGSAIPLSARILAVADAFDAMTSSRTFREAFSVERALAELRKNSGTQFDPDIVEALCRMAGRIGAEQLMGKSTSVQSDAEHAAHLNDGSC